MNFSFLVNRRGLRGTEKLAHDYLTLALYDNLRKRSPRNPCSLRPRSHFQDICAYPHVRLTVNVQPRTDLNLRLVYSCFKSVLDSFNTIGSTSAK